MRKKLPGSGADCSKNIYSGFLEGVADQKINQHLVQQFVKDVEDSSVNQKPHLFLQKTNPLMNVLRYRHMHVR